MEINMLSAYLPDYLNVSLFSFMGADFSKFHGALKFELQRNSVKGLRTQPMSKVSTKNTTNLQSRIAVCSLTSATHEFHDSP
jgi:hypothetical protein